MGKIVKFALPIAAIGLGAGMFGAGPLAGMMGGGAGVGAGFLQAAPGLGGATAAGFVNPITAGGGGFFSSLFSSRGLGLATRLISATTDVIGGVTESRLADIQARDIQNRVNVRNIQIQQEQQALADRRRDLVASITNNMLPGQSQRAMLRDTERRFKTGQLNISVTGQSEIASLEAEKSAAKLSGRSGLLTSFLRAGRKSLIGYQKFKYGETPA
jgi:hypothetical protein